MPVPRADKRRRWRVSVYKIGNTQRESFPLIHKASRSKDIAESHFVKYAALVGVKDIGRVILHQGKLYRGYAVYIENDTDWRLKRSEHATLPSL